MAFLVTQIRYISVFEFIFLLLYEDVLITTIDQPVDQVNRDPLTAEMQRLRQQLELAQVELICARAGGPSNSDMQVHLSAYPNCISPCSSRIRNLLPILIEFYREMFILPY